LLSLEAVDRSDPSYLREQVAAEIRRAIFRWRSRSGRTDPQAKDSVAVLGGNTNTVLRALRPLRDEGLVEMGWGCHPRRGTPGAAGSSRS